MKRNEEEELEELIDEAYNTGKRNVTKTKPTKEDEKPIAKKQKKKGVRFFEGDGNAASDASVSTEGLIKQSESVSSQPAPLKGITETKRQDEYQNFLAAYLLRIEEKREAGQILTDHEVLCVSENADSKTIKDRYKFLSSVLNATLKYKEGISEKGNLESLYKDVQQAYGRLSKSKANSQTPVDQKTQTSGAEEKKDAIEKDLAIYKQIVDERSKFSKIKRMLIGEYLSEHEFKAFELLRAGKVELARMDLKIDNAQGAIYHAKKLTKARSR